MSKICSSSKSGRLDISGPWSGLGLSLLGLSLLPPVPKMFLDEIAYIYGRSWLTQSPLQDFLPHSHFKSYSKMASPAACPMLNSIPEDMLLLIVESIPCSYLPNLALASRKQHRLATPALYRFIEFCPRNAIRLFEADFKYGLPTTLKNLSPSQISLVFNLQKLVDALERKAIL